MSIFKNIITNNKAKNIFGVFYEKKFYISKYKSIDNMDIINRQYYLYKLSQRNHSGSFCDLAEISMENRLIPFKKISIYSSVNDIIQDKNYLETAMMFAERGLELGDNRAWSIIARILYKQKRIEDDLYTTCLLKGGDMDDFWCQTILSLSCYNSKDIFRIADKSFLESSYIWLRKPLEKEFPNALFLASYFYSSGYWKKDQDKSVKLMKKAVSLGHIGAMFQLGRYEVENGRKHYGFYLIKKAASEGVSEAGDYIKNNYEQYISKI